MEKKLHANIPLFIPHEGCPNACVFCNQRKITGKSDGADRDIRQEIERALETIDREKYDIEIAFFGGSFTGIDRRIMERLLSDAYSYIKDGRADSIRLSTRPDYISDEILDILEKYGVRSIELGVQSASDRVLSLCRRGHTADISEKALRRIVSRGFIAGGQMMIGLPGASLSDEKKTAELICRSGASESRIYPTVVFRDTELCEMTKERVYTPLSTEEAVKRCAAVYKIFQKNGVKVLRVGLQASEILADKNEVFAGVNHPAVGELCESELYTEKITDMINEQKELAQKARRLEIFCPVGETSKISGQNKTGREKIKMLFKNDIRLKITEKPMEKFSVELKYE